MNDPRMDRKRSLGRNVWGAVQAVAYFACAAVGAYDITRAAIAWVFS